MEKDGQGVCVPNYHAVCWLWGDPHYQSFDGRNFDFQGTCDYVLATTECPAGSAPGLTPFTVTTKNENRGNPSVSYVRQVTVSTLGVNISIHKNEIGKVRVGLARGTAQPSTGPLTPTLDRQERLCQTQWVVLNTGLLFIASSSSVKVSAKGFSEVVQLVGHFPCMHSPTWVWSLVPHMNL